MSKTIRNVAAAVLIVAGFFIYLVWQKIAPVNDTKSREKNDIVQLLTALNTYKTEYGGYPKGDHAGIMTALRGDNPRKLVFFEPRPRSLNERGELIDRWKTPYRIDIDAVSTPHVSSAGKNKIFEGDTKNSDDIRIRN